MWSFHMPKKMEFIEGDLQNYQVSKCRQTGGHNFKILFYRMKYTGNDNIAINLILAINRHTDGQNRILKSSATLTRQPRLLLNAI